MSLPDASSAEAATLLQLALGHVTVTGGLGPQTIAAVTRLDLTKFRPKWQAQLRAQQGDGDIAWIDAVLSRAA